MRSWGKRQEKVEEEEEVVVVEEGDWCTLVARMVRRKEEGKRGAPPKL
jgi:hypothetical protein